jgi:hypothetical protein
MTANKKVERRIADFYASEAPVRAPGRVLELALETVERTPQRRSRLHPPQGLLRLSPFARLAVAGLAVIAVGVGLVLMRPVSGPGTIGPSPSPPATPSPSLLATPSPSPPATPSSAGISTLSGALEPGRYQLAPGFPVPITFEIRDGWEACSPSPVEQGLCRVEVSRPEGVSFLIVDNVVADPCGETLKDPAVGPSVNDLVTAISHLQGFEATPPVDLSVDGYAGKQFEVTAPSRGVVCDLRTWATADRTNGVGAGEVNLIRILDVDGVRVMIAGAYFPSLGPPDTRAQIEEILASVSIGG